MFNFSSSGGLRGLSKPGPTGKMVRATILLVFGACALLFVRGGSGDWTEEKTSHEPRKLTTSRLKKLIQDLPDIDTMWKSLLKPMLIERVPGTPGNLKVRNFIIDQLKDLPAGWTVEEDKFTDSTPYGEVEFSNIIATLNPQAKRHLTLACHYDSKKMKFKFLGAIDSAVPCALMLHIVKNLDSQLGIMKNKQGYLQEWWQRFQQWAQWRGLSSEAWEGARQYAHQLSSNTCSKKDGTACKDPDLNLQLIFFDGEEAFREWTATDSIYGARHLAKLMEETPHTRDLSRRKLDGMDMMVLLDLLGAKNPRFHNFQRYGAQNWYNRMRDLEKLLHKGNHLEEHRSSNEYFTGTPYNARIEDDHIPFLQRGVNILHLIPAPFPPQWHKASDDETGLDKPTTSNLNKILTAFVYEYLHLGGSK